MSIVTVCAFSLTACVAILVLRASGSPAEKLLPILVSGILLVTVVFSVEPIISTIEKAFSYTGISSDYLKTALKALGICYITAMTADICTDCGQTALSAQVSLAGRVAVVILTLPYISEILSAVMSLIE